jgi:hypothetical protein
MFQPLAAQVGVDNLFIYHPADLLEYIERCWEACTQTNVLGVPQNLGRGNIDLINEFASRARPYRSGVRDANAPVAPPEPISQYQPQLPIPPQPDWMLPWRHLIYAYALENTRIIEVFRKVIDELIHGERLGRPDWEVQRWMRNTEELFFSDRLGFSILSLTSSLRPDSGSIRRNAYYRLLGMDLNHGLDDGRPYSYVKPDVANKEFARQFELLLQETWRAYSNRNNAVGPNTTDPTAISDLCRRLRRMLQDRRIYDNLAQEEFYACTMLSWFHMTVLGDSPIINLLQAQGTEPAERLRIVGQRVGVPTHTKSYNYFRMAGALSSILWRIELGNFDTPAGAANLYIGGQVTNWMTNIINHWSAATGRNLKEFVGTPGQYLQETSFVISRPLVQQGGNGYHSLVKTR